jgi:hypothetical protein
MRRKGGVLSVITRLDVRGAQVKKRRDRYSLILYRPHEFIVGDIVVINGVKRIDRFSRKVTNDLQQFVVTSASKPVLCIYPGMISRGSRRTVSRLPKLGDVVEMFHG